MHVYACTHNYWVNFGDDIYGESVIDILGNYVTISNDGKTVDIGGTCNYGFCSSSEYEIISVHLHDSWVKVVWLG